MTGNADGWVALFGHGAPVDHPLLAGLPVRDVTRRAAKTPPGSRIAPLLEPFMDPFARAFLHGLEAGALDGAAAVQVWRQGAGALLAFRYAMELRRLGLLPPGPPLYLWNAARGTGPAAQAFDAVQAARLGAALAALPRGPATDRAPPLAALEAMQAQGSIRGAEAFRRRLAARETGLPLDLSPDLSHDRAPSAPRLALAGAPLGGDGLHRWLDRRGALVLDLQGPDAPPDEIATLLAARRVQALVWQVDPHDDLHGWRRPALARLCAGMGIRFHDLGFLPAFPAASDLPEVLP